jgi:hypothetical protein
MASARQDAEWERTAELLAMVFNAHMDTKKSGVKCGADFYRPRRLGRRRKEPLTATVGSAELKSILVNSGFIADDKGTRP